LIFFFFYNTPSLFVGQLFYSRSLTEAVSSISISIFVQRIGLCRLLWLRRRPPRGRVKLLSLCCDVVCGFSRGIDGAKRQSMTSVGEITAEEGRGRKCCIVPSRRTLAYETSMVPQDHCQRTGFDPWSCPDLRLVSISWLFSVSLHPGSRCKHWNCTA
jgi:hypothetical protein